MSMSMEAVTFWFIIGAFIGWLVGEVVKSSGFGIFGDIVIGGAGAVIAGWFLPKVGIEIGPGVVADVVNSIMGAVLFLLLVGFIKKADETTSAGPRKKPAYKLWRG